jgi:hypothetical protein
MKTPDSPFSEAPLYHCEEIATSGANRGTAPSA